MKNGYPISHSSSTYDPDNPYANRDNRFNEYIVYNNSLLKKARIYTYVDAPSNGINVLESSTRTGYYLKKFMDEGAFNQTFMTGAEFAKWVANEEIRHRLLMQEAGFVAK